jgi:methionine-rich copper-binding protein CopC
MKRRSKLWGAVAACLITQLAQAHAHLERSLPADGSTLSAAPAALEMRFSEAAQLTALWIQRNQEPRQALKSLPVSADRTLRVALPALAPGVYNVTWRVLSADGHIASGTLRFTVSSGAR